MKKRKQSHLKKFRTYFFCIAFFLVFSLFSYAQSSYVALEEFSRVDFVLGTVCRLRFFADLSQNEAKSLFDKVFTELEKLDKIFNANINLSEDEADNIFTPKSSELELVNKNAGIKPVKVSKELFELLEISLVIAKESDGAFNPAIGKLVKLWDIGFSGKSVPLQKEITSALSLINYEDIILEKSKELNGKTSYTVFLKKKTMRLDLGGIAKGYATDKVVSILKEAGIKNALIDIGGNLFALGKKSNGKLWTVGLKNPNIGESGISAIIQVSNKSLVTSGNYERYFEENGEIYHHILDSKTGYPVKNKLNAVSVLSNKSLYADALSTTCFILGLEKSRELINKLNLESKDSIAVIFFYNDNTIKILGNPKTKLKVLQPFKILF